MIDIRKHGGIFDGGKKGDSLYFEPLGEIQTLTSASLATRGVVMLDETRLLGVYNTKVSQIFDIKTMTVSPTTGDITKLPEEPGHFYHMLDFGNLFGLAMNNRIIIYDKKTLSKLKVIDHSEHTNFTTMFDCVSTGNGEDFLLSSPNVLFVFNTKKLEVTSKIIYPYSFPSSFTNDFIEGDLLYYCESYSLNIINYKTKERIYKKEVVPYICKLLSCGKLGDKHFYVSYYDTSDGNYYEVKIFKKDTFEEVGRLLRRQAGGTVYPSYLKFPEGKRLVITDNGFTEWRFRNKDDLSSLHLNQSAVIKMPRPVESLFVSANEKIAYRTVWNNLSIYKITKG